MAITDTNYSADEDDIFDAKAHKKLLENVTNSLGKTQHIKKPTRNEPTLTTDEFHLVKTGPSAEFKVKDTSVSVGDLVKVLNKSNKHLSVGRELNNTARNKKVLPKPLERPVADRIQRTVGYEKAKKSLSKWDAVVAKNRSSDHQVFPIETETIHVDLKEAPQRSIKTDLMIELEAIDKKLRAIKNLQAESKEPNYTELQVQKQIMKDEMAARRKELAYMRIRESQKSAKARLQNKIKSKKFHKLLKKDKLKEQLKEFEILQKSNPEAALEKLEKIEKQRIQERAQLRHKNTGTWAKNLQVRAKYDKDVRKDLSEQLALSRELTQKLKPEEDDEEKNSDSDKEDDFLTDVDPFNPWVKVSKKQNKNEVDEFVEGYRKYWLERNQNQEQLVEYNKDPETIPTHTEIQKQNLVVDQVNELGSNKLEKTLKKNDKISKRNETTKKKIVLKSSNRSKLVMENGWIVEELKINSNIRNNDIDDIFDEAEDIVEQKAKKIIKNLSRSLSVQELLKQTHSQKKNELQNLSDLTFKNQKQRPDFDEELIETIKNKSTNGLPVKNNALVNELTKEEIVQSSDVIDPNKFANIKPKKLNTGLPNMDITSELFEDDEHELDDENSKQMAIAEAFEDDDIVADFEKEKEDGNKEKDINLSLPGWGSWAGCGIDPNKQLTKRLILKFPKKDKRREENSNMVYINDSVNKKLKEHLVSDLPFPFTKVQDYEASIRQPIGRSFVPETAFRMLTRPAVVTKRGQIIEPMDESVLVAKPKKPRTTVDARIEKMLKKDNEKKNKLIK